MRRVKKKLIIISRGWGAVKKPNVIQKGRLLHLHRDGSSMVYAPHGGGGGGGGADIYNLTKMK